MEVKPIRNRSHSVLVRLNEQEQSHLKKLVQQSGLSQEELLRKIITGYQVKAAPPIEYHEMIRQMLAIGNSLNQIAVKLNTLSMFDAKTFSNYYSALMNTVLEIQRQIESPHKL